MREDWELEKDLAARKQPLPPHEHVDHRPTVEPAKAYKPTVCVDFDGVIHRYDSPWQAATVIPDPPVDGAFAALAAYLDAGLRVCVYSTRSTSAGGLWAMKLWFNTHRFSRTKDLEFPTEKPPAVLYIDDRGFTFEGTFPTPDAVRAFVPWNKRPAVA